MSWQLEMRLLVQAQFRKNKLALLAWYIICLMGATALLADFIANDKPLLAKVDGVWYFPVLKQYSVDLGWSGWPGNLSMADWRNLEYETVIWPPIPYLARNLDHKQRSVGPFDGQESLRWRHWLGTDDLGRDILAGMIHGTRVALSVGMVAMGIAGLIGILLGSLAGFFGDNKLSTSRIGLWLNLGFLIPAIFYGFVLRSYALSETEGIFAFMGQVGLSILIFTAVMVLANLIAIPLKRVAFLGKQVKLPVDLIISRLIELMVTFPKLFLIIAIVAVTRPSIIMVMVVIGLTSWTGIARFIRAELLSIRSREYIEAARAMGYSNMRLLFRHALPNGLQPVVITLAFGMAAAILVETTLSFLGLGVSAETVSWGALLSKARETPGDWWLAVFPGLGIFLSITSLNLIGEGLTDALDPRLK